MLKNTVFLLIFLFFIFIGESLPPRFVCLRHFWAVPVSVVLFVLACSRFSTFRACGRSSSFLVSLGWYNGRFFFVKLLRYDCVLYGTFGVGEGVGVDDGCWLGKM